MPSPTRPSQAERVLRLKRQALEARHKRWIGRGVVRSFETGTTFTLAESMLDMLDAISPDKDKRFLLTRVTHVGVNNLPKDLSDTLTRQADKNESGAAVLPHWIDETLRARAADPDAFVRAQISAFASGDVGRPVMPGAAS